MSLPSAMALSSIVEIYPREGTETLRRLSLFQNLRVEIYPREGTETSLSHNFSPFPHALKFIPVRGRKRHSGD